MGKGECGVVRSTGSKPEQSAPHYCQSVVFHIDELLNAGLPSLNKKGGDCKHRTVH